MTLEGVVVAFDEHRGDGEVALETGERLYFHCVAIADGSRHVDVGARVRGVRAVGRRGRDEMGSIETL